MSLPDEKVVELKQIIHAHLSQKTVQTKIKNLLLESLHNVFTADDEVVTDQILQIIRHHGIIDIVMKELQFEEKNKYDWSQTDEVKQIEDVPVTSSKRHLYLQVVRGRAFLAHLLDPELLPGQIRSHFKLFVNFGGQRFISNPTPCACEPEFNEGFLLEIPRSNTTKATVDMDTALELLGVCNPIHLVIVKIDPVGHTTLVTSHFLEWRTILMCPDGKMNMPVELLGTDTENKIPIGMLELKLELVPRVVEPLAADILDAQLNLEKNQRTERERLFLVYSKQWWKEYLQIRTAHQNRYVKIFAHDENMVNHPVCTYIHPLRAGRFIETPKEAAWFVALIPLNQTPGLGGSNLRHSEKWCHSHSLLCLNEGNCEEHAVLLCNLLLGFELDAFVCIGSIGKNEPYAWVVTFAYKGLTVFWDPVKATRYVHEPINPNDPPILSQPKPKYPYTKIGCLFNHRTFYANCQPSDSLFTCKFELSNESLWKAMASDSITSVRDRSIFPWVQAVPLLPNMLDPILASNDLELELRALTTEFRIDLGLTTVWDEHLSYLLSPALAAYEAEKKLGISADTEEFQQGIRRAVPNGHTFKGFPIRFGHNYARRIFASSLRSTICQDILRCRGDSVRHAVRVRIFTYPERVLSAWIMFAVKYKKVL